MYTGGEKVVVRDIGFLDRGTGACVLEEEGLGLKEGDLRRQKDERF